MRNNEIFRLQWAKVATRWAKFMIDPHEAPLSKKDICRHCGFGKTKFEKLMKLNIIPYQKHGTSRQARVFFYLTEVKAALERAFGHQSNCT